MRLISKICIVSLVIILSLSILCLAQGKRNTPIKRSPSKNLLVGFECSSGKPNQTRPEIVNLRLGDVTRKAIELPQPEYPQEAKAAGVSGNVRVQVVIDLPSGKIVWARIESGHPLLQEAVKKIMCQARFHHTNDIPPLRAKAIIIYRFGNRKRVPPNNSFNRSGISLLFIHKIEGLRQFFPARLIRAVR